MGITALMFGLAVLFIMGCASLVFSYKYKNKTVVTMAFVFWFWCVMGLLGIASAA